MEFKLLTLTCRFEGFRYWRGSYIGFSIGTLDWICDEASLLEFGAYYDSLVFDFLYLRPVYYYLQRLYLYGR